MAVLRSNWLYALQRLSFSPWFPVLLGILCGCFVGLLLSVGALDSYEYVLYDWRFNQRAPIAPSRSVNVVYINDATLKNMADSLSRWPWSRNVWAAFQQEILNPIQAKTVVYDIVFDLPDSEPEADQAFASVIRNSKNILMTSLFRDAREGFISLAERQAYQEGWQQPPEEMQRLALGVDLSQRRWEVRYVPDYMTTDLPLSDFLTAAAGSGATTYEP
ncbi:MAG TPA: CHASE2 domain-containing protein, partial [bacterium]|nr:CHASE2 domain-containing protein [bacterium]